MTHKSTPLHSAAPTIIPADFWINRPVGYTIEGLPLYPSFGSAAPTKEQVIADLEDALDNVAIDSPRFVYLADQLEQLTGKVVHRYDVANLEFLADLLIMLATDWVEDDRGYCVDVSDILALFDGAVETDIVDPFTRRLIGPAPLVERTLAGWVPNADLNNAHNVEAFQRALSTGATDWNGANADGHPVDVDGLYDADNAGFFDKFGCADTFGFSECDESFFTHNDCGEGDWD